MKFNWGTGIFLFYSFFVAALAFQVYKSTQYDRTLVVEDYYAQDLQYQSHLDKLQNSADLPEKVRIELERPADRLTIQFPENLPGPTGTVSLYRPDDKNLDLQLPLKVDDHNRMTLPTAPLKPGKWKVQVDWQSDGVPYFDEKVIFIDSAGE
ncbi:MAG: hypothetical protein D6765_12475 [Bacteroidetes bacterium]|nr:MAG: hypothetical protein D6765_12475 [Bacteroidota bacterium]